MGESRVSQDSIYYMFEAPRACLELTPRGLQDSNYVLRAASEDKHICFLNNDRQPHFFYMYEALFSKFRVWIPFTDSQIEIVLSARIAPSQLHSNNWALIPDFEIVCDY